jgi:F-type H+-transporting ATPase subunit a
VAEQKPGKKIGCLGCAIPLASVIILLVIIVPVSIFGIISGAFVNKSIPAPTVELPSSTIFNIGPFPVTNTIITSWIAIAILALIGILVTRRSKLIPTRIQSIVEMIIEWMYNFCKDVAGEENGRRFFPFVTTIFLFVLLSALLNLVPGFGSITFNTAEGVVPLLRGANTDINTSLAIAIMAFLFIEFWGFKNNGFGYLKKFFNFSRAGKGWVQVFTGKIGKGIGNILMGAIDTFVGFLEFFSEIIRIVSFTFRLFGNMTGGEILILILFFLLGFAGFGAVQLGYAFEILVGVVQALIFSGLTLVFASMAAEKHEEDHAGKL